MNKPLVVGATTLTLLFGGTGVATASTFDAPATTTTTMAQAQEADQEDGGDNGLWGLAGLLGLLGLAGLKRRKDADYPATRAGGTITTTGAHKTSSSERDPRQCFWRGSLLCVTCSASSERRRSSRSRRIPTAVCCRVDSARFDTCRGCHIVDRSQRASHLRRRTSTR